MIQFQVVQCYLNVKIITTQKATCLYAKNIILVCLITVVYRDWMQIVTKIADVQLPHLNQSVIQTKPFIFPLVTQVAQMSRLLMVKKYVYHA